MTGIKNSQFKGVNHKNLGVSILFLIYFLSIGEVMCQESIFTALKSDLKRADKYFHEARFPLALELYLSVQDRDKGEGSTDLKIARTYYQLKDLQKAMVWYDKYYRQYNSLPNVDWLNYAETLSSAGQYEKAVQFYIAYLKKNPQAKGIEKKIWRLKNIEYLYEDSIYYSVKPLSINSEYADFGPGYFEDGLVFVSNRKTFHGINKIDETNNAPFQSLYYVKIEIDTSAVRAGPSFGKPVHFSRSLNSKFHQGVCAFFPGQEKMIYTKNSQLRSKKTESNLQLFLAEKKEGVWRDVKPFIHNRPDYSMCHPALSPDGKTLFFASDMPDGYGGKDLYKCRLVDNEWTKPENLGNTINTEGDETFPFYHHSGEFYFASTGHAGLGGMDIFKVKLSENKIGEVLNPGYPLNTSFDDFGIILNAEGTNGFLSSNRNHGGLNDDIFAIEIDLQNYPLTISGTLKYKTVNWQDTSVLAVLPYAKLALIDNRKNLTVYKTTTDSLGHFKLDIPYSSQYKIRVFEKNLGLKLVSLEIPKNKKKFIDHEIVIVKSQFEGSAEDADESVYPIDDKVKKTSHETKSSKRDKRGKRGKN